MAMEKLAFRIEKDHSDEIKRQAKAANKDLSSFLRDHYETSLYYKPIDELCKQVGQLTETVAELTGKVEQQRTTLSTVLELVLLNASSPEETKELITHLKQEGLL